MSKHDERVDRKKIKAINLISFFLGFSQAVLIYVMSTYFKEASGNENVSGFYFFAYGVLLLVLLNLYKLSRRFGQALLFLIVLFFKIVVLILLANLNPSGVGIFMLMLYVVLSGLEWVNLDVLLEAFSCDKESGRIRGKHLTLLNAGFFLGPFLSTWLLKEFDFAGIFIFLFVFNVLILFYALIRLRGVHDKPRTKISVLALFKKVLLRKDILPIYYVAFVLDFFFALMIIYTPLYLIKLGMDWSQIGIVFSVMLLPFVFLQYPMGVLADKKIGEKKLLFFAILITACFTGAIVFIESASILIWSLVLFGTRVGAAMIEILRDSYFYKCIDGGDVDLIGFFRTSMPVGYILGAMTSFVVLFNFSLSIIFILSAVVVFSAIIPVMRLKEK